MSVPAGTETFATGAGAPATASRVLDTEEKRAASPLAAFLKEIHVTYGKSPYQIGWDMLSRFFSFAKVLPEEYVKMRLFDDSRLSKTEKNAFLGNAGIRRVAMAINHNPDWNIVTFDKIIMETLLRGLGFPVVRTKAYVHRQISYPSITAIESADTLKSYLRTPEHYPLFGKPVHGSLSLGSVGLMSYAAATDSIRLMNGSDVAVEAFASEVFQSYDSGYLLQDCLESHPLVASYTGPAVSTVRFFTLAGNGSPEIFRCVWKLPAGRSMADNFWRGNLLAALDPSSGRITRVIRGTGLEQQAMECHPDSQKPFAELVVPNWEETRAMVLRAARCYDGVPLIGWDVAVTASGGTIVEMNNCPDLNLAQMAEGRGAFDATLSATYKTALAARESLKRQSRKRGARLRHERRRDLRTAVTVEASTNKAAH